MGVLRGRHILLGVSGGIAAYKSAHVARELLRAGATVQAVLTRGAQQFVGVATFEGLTGRKVLADTFDDPSDISHVRMAREADAAVIAPATANIIGKFACGIADDLLTSTFTCLQCPVVIAPAMHAEMWAHPAIAANAHLLTERGAVLVGPEEGELAGGDRGLGRLAEPIDIVAAVARALRGTATISRISGMSGVSDKGDRPQLDERMDSPLRGHRVVVTAGGTREPIDPVRFLGNRSTGKMGFAIAKAAADRGAIVDLVAAPSPLATPDNAARHDVTTALQMHEMVMSLAEGASAIVKAAAVADYRPAIYHQQKIKKDEQDPGHLELVRNPDILYDLGHRRFNGDRPVLVGFAAETDNGRRHATDKLQRKNVDLIVMNRVDAADAGFEVDTNAVTIYGVDGGPLEVTLRSKDEVAAAIWDEVEKLVITRGPVE